MSYYLDKERPLQTATYRIFDTSLWIPGLTEQ